MNFERLEAELQELANEAVALRAMAEPLQQRARALQGMNFQGSETRSE